MVLTIVAVLVLFLAPPGLYALVTRDEPPIIGWKADYVGALVVWVPALASVGALLFCAIRLVRLALAGG